MTILQLSEAEELQPIKQRYSEANIEFEPVLKEAYIQLQDVHMISTPTEKQIIGYIIDFLSEYLLKQLKPKRKFWQVVLDIALLGVPAIVRNLQKR